MAVTPSLPDLANPNPAGPNRASPNRAGPSLDAVQTGGGLDAHRRLPLTRRQVRRVLGVLWLIDAGFQAQPAFFSATVWRQDIAQSVMGEPPWVAHSIFWAIGIIATHAAAWNVLFVLVQCAFGAALLTDRYPRLAIVASIPYVLAVWWVGEGFGALPTGFALLAAGAPGAAVLYPVLGLLAWPSNRPSDRQEPPDAADAGNVRSTPIAQRIGSAVWIVLWAGQCLLLLPWVYPPAQVLTANIEESSIGQPGWLVELAHHAGATAASAPILAVVTMGAIQLLVGLGLLGSRTRRTALVLGLVTISVFWVVGQDFGGIFASGSTDPNSAPLIALLALALWPSKRTTTHRSRRSVVTNL